MMATFEVVAPGGGDVPVAHHGEPDPVAALVRATTPAPVADATIAVLDAVASSGRPASMSVLDRPLPAIPASFVCALPPG